MNFTIIAFVVVFLAFAASIHQHFVLKRKTKTQWMRRLHWGAAISFSYLVIQLYNPAVFMTALATIGVVCKSYDLFRAKYAPREHEISLVTELTRDMWLFVLVFWAFRTLVYDYSAVPSGSMEPTLEAGDLIAINKLAYQVKIPPIRKPLFKFNTPERGDIVVINSPIDPETFYIKRIIAVGGDTVVYKNKQYIVNGKPYEQSNKKLSYTKSYSGDGWYTHLTETIDEKAHSIQLDDAKFNKTVEIVVPEGQYFISGDNRDYSLDSRIFGPINEDSIVGKATHIITHFELPGIISFSRSGELY